jgi:sialidase-1
MYYILYVWKNFFMQLKPNSVLMLIMITCVFATCKKTQAPGVEQPGFTVYQDRVPVLTGKTDNQLVRISIPGKGHRLTGVAIRLTGTTDINDIKSIRLYYTGMSRLFNTQTLVATATATTGIINIPANLPLKEAENNTWLSVELNNQAGLLHYVNAVPVSIELDGKEQSVFTDSTSGPQRVGIALRKAGDDGVNTYRIPGMATTKTGALVAVYDIRHKSSADLQGDIDVGMSRSTDGGKTWEPMQTIMDMGTYGNRPQDENGIGDPSILVDDATGTIWVAALWLHGYPGQRAWTASQPGLSPDKTGQFMLTKSTDDGKTWSQPINITSQVKDPAWQLCFQGPGRGITMQDGTLVFPAQFKDSSKLPHSTIVYSKDHGQSWHLGTAAYPNTTEAQVVETEPGTLMLNMRDNRGGFRTIYITRDLGKTWSEHPSSRKALQDPVCNASIIKHIYKGKTVLFFANPDAARSRTHMTVKASLDMGLTWSSENQLMLDELTGNGYPVLTVIDEDHLGLLYEGSQVNLVFQKIPVSDILRTGQK